MAQPEARLSKRIMEAWRKEGVWCFKVWGNEHQTSGVPDILGTYRGQFIGCETKMPGGELSDIQRYRISRIRKAGGLVVVARSVPEAMHLIHHLRGGYHEKCTTSRQRCVWATGREDEE